MIRTPNLHRTPWLHWLLFALVALSLFTTYSLTTDAWLRGGVRDDWQLCISFLREGTLYGGQPFCHHGPVFLYALTALEAVFGMDALTLVTTILNLMLNTLILLILTRMVQQQTGKPHMLLMLLLYATVPFLYALTNFLIVVAAAFGMGGMYVLSGTPTRRQEWAAGTLFALAVLTHPTILFCIAALLLFYWSAQKPVMRWSRRTLSRDGLWSMVALLAPAFLLFMVFFIRYPKFPYYVFLIATKLNPLSLLSTFFNLFPLIIPKLNVFNLTAYVVLSVSLIAFWRIRNMLSATVLFGFLLGFIAVGRTLLLDAELTYIRYFFFALSLFCALAVIEFAQLPRVKRFTLLAALLLLIVLPRLVLVGVEIAAWDTRKLVEYPRHYLPLAGSTIAIEDFSVRDVVVRYRPYGTIDPARLDVLTTSRAYFIDPGNVPGFQHYRLVDDFPYWERYAEFATAGARNVIFQNILDRKYDLLILGPPHWEVLQGVSTAALRADPALLKAYCPVRVPNFQYFARGDAAKFNTIWFKNLTACTTFTEQMRAYYHAHWDELCARSPYLAGEIATQDQTITPPYPPCQEPPRWDLVDLHQRITLSFDGFGERSK